MVRQAIQPGILGEIRKKLETIEGQETSKKRDNEDNPGRGRNWGKIRNSRMDGGRWRQNGQHGRPTLRVVEKFLGMRKLKRRMVSWLGKTAKSLFIFLFFSFLFLLDLQLQDKAQESITWLCHNVTMVWQVVTGGQVTGHSHSVSYD